MKMHSRDKRKWFAANFGRSYFKSPPLVSPFITIGLLVPMLILAVVAVLAMPHGSAGMVLAAPITALKDVFNSQSAESVRLVGEKEKHLATYNAMMEQFNAEDDKAILLAAQWRNEQAAGSPRAPLTIVKLRQARWTRDALKAAWLRERDRIFRALELITGPLIHTFHEYALDFAQRLGSQYRLEKSAPYYDRQRDLRLVTVRTNSAKIDGAIKTIFRRINEVNEMGHGTLADLDHRIAECKAELMGFDLSDLEEQQPMSAERAPKPIRPNKNRVEFVEG